MQSRLLFLLALPLVVSGCVGGGDVFAVVPVVGGEKLRVPLSQQVPAAKSDEVEVGFARFEPQASGQALLLRCELKLLKPVALRRVTIEDVAGERPVVLVDDQAPRADGPAWKGASTPLSRDDSRIAWLVSLENSIRVYRFTIETADGRRIVLNQPAVFPGFAKVQMRQALGLTY